MVIRAGEAWTYTRSASIPSSRAIVKRLAEGLASRSLTLKPKSCATAFSSSASSIWLMVDYTFQSGLIERTRQRTRGRFIANKRGSVGGFAAQPDRSCHQIIAVPATSAPPPQITHHPFPVMKLSGAKATSKPCRIQMSPTMMRMIPEASRSIRRAYLDIWGDPGEHSGPHADELPHRAFRRSPRLPARVRLFRRLAPLTSPPLFVFPPPNLRLRHP